MNSEELFEYTSDQGICYAQVINTFKNNCIIIKYHITHFSNLDTFNIKNNFKLRKKIKFSAYIIV